MSKHTPGPWEVVDQGEQVWVQCLDPHAEYICETLGAFRGPNAHLIAAAPELLEAAKQLSARTDNAHVQHHEALDRAAAIGSCPWCVLQAAIAKAEGGQ